MKAVMPLPWFRLLLIGRLAQLRHGLKGRQFAVRFADACSLETRS